MKKNIKNGASRIISVHIVKNLLKTLSNKIRNKNTSEYILRMKKSQRRRKTESRKKKTKRQKYEKRNYKSQNQPSGRQHFRRRVWFHHVCGV